MSFVPIKMSPKKRSTYTLSYKLEAVNYAELTSNQIASEHFGVNISQIVRWKKQKADMEEKPSKVGKVMRRFRSNKWPALEAHLKTWVLNERDQGRQVSGSSILRQARSRAIQMELADFKGSAHWIFAFMKRNNIVRRAVNSIGQSLQDNWKEKMSEFVRFVTTHKDNYSLESIGSMDEVPVTFDMPSKFTVDKRGASDIRILMTGVEKIRFTVVLCVTVNGYKLPAYIIFRGKVVPKMKLPPNVMVSANSKACMNSAETLLWHEKIWMKRKNAIFEPKSLLILDAAPGHIKEEVKARFHSRQTLMAMIPGGLTKKLQALDIGVNKSFKTLLRGKWEKWMIQGYKQYTKSGHMKRASYEEIVDWTSKAWNEVPTTAIKNGFRKTTINFYNEEQNLSDEENGEDEEFYETVESDEEADVENRQIREQLMDVLFDDRNFGSEEECDE